MIELTEQQAQAMKSRDRVPTPVLNPWTKETFVLLRTEEYARLTEQGYDDSPWTRQELEALAWETGRGIGWEDMDEYDKLPEKS